MTGSDDVHSGCDGRATQDAGPTGWFDDTSRAADDLGLSFVSPVPPQSRMASVNGLCLRYLDWGNAHLPDLLFIHGFAQQAHSWDFAALAVQDLFHVVSIDLRGHGESDRAPNSSYTFDDMYADIDAFISSNSLDSPVICGLSLGGTLSYMYASRNPEGVGALVIAESAPESRREGRESIRSFTSGPTVFDSLEELVEKVRTLTPWRSVEQVRSSLVHSVAENGDGKWTWKYDPEIRTLHSSYGGPEARWDALQRIQVPTLLVRGEDSDITNAAIFERMADLIPGSQMASIADAGHRVSGDNPAQFNAALRSFLLELPGVSRRTDQSAQAKGR